MNDRTSRAHGIRRVHRIAVAAGAVVIALVMVTTVASPSTCGNLPARYPPIVAFELARSGHDLEAVFGDRRHRFARCRHNMIAKMDTLNHADFALFIPAYGAFLIASLVGLGRRGRRFTGAGIGFVALAMAGDVAENICLLGLTPALDPTSIWLAILPWVSGVKWLALGGVGALVAAGLWRTAERHRLSIGLCLLTPAAAIAGLADPHRFGPLLVTGIAASWAILFIDGLVQARTRLDA